MFVVRSGERAGENYCGEVEPPQNITSLRSTSTLSSYNLSPQHQIFTIIKSPHLTVNGSSWGDGVVIGEIFIFAVFFYFYFPHT